MLSRRAIITSWLACAVVAAASPALAQNADPRRGAGQAFAQRVCAECHAVLATERRSPRADAASFHAIANTPGMTETALFVWLQTSHPTMPNLMLAPKDRDDVAAYILSLREPR